MEIQRTNPLFHPIGILAVAIALSIGWGIRGNYGHETGAMFPGALAALAACLFSGREDWQRRVVYFGFFGMLGWALGGSISYMQVIGYTHSGHSDTQLFGFYSLFFIGFLWAALGGGAAAIPAVLSSDRLDKLFRPLVVLLVTWSVLFFYKDAFKDWIQHRFELDGIDSPSRRQELALYWFDSDWFETCCVLVALLGFQCWQLRREQIYRLPMFAAIGGAFLFILALGIQKMLGFQWLGSLVQVQGIAEGGFPAEQLAVSNWPPAILHWAASTGWYFAGDRLALLIGMFLGTGWFFQQYGRFDEGVSLFVHMALGWLIAFLLLPVLGSLFLADYGGLRMTPPRGDNWAGVLGAYLGACLFLWRADLKPIIFASIVCGTIGGLGFSGTAWLESGLVSMGNPNDSSEISVQEAWKQWQTTPWSAPPEDPQRRMAPPTFDPPLLVDEKWQHWQNQNWHSFLEQTYGFCNGIGVAIALAFLARRGSVVDDEPVSLSWKKITAAVFLIPLLTYANMMKNLQTWIEAGFPKAMMSPWVPIELSSLTWFNIFWLVGTLAFVALLLHHRGRPLACVPNTALGRGQWLFLLLLWGFVAGNFARALPNFHAQRLLTEGIILLNAILVTLLVLGFTYARTRPVTDDAGAVGKVRSRPPSLVFAMVFAVVSFVVFPYAAHRSVRHLYGDAPTGKRGMDFRFGPNANWKRAPLLKGAVHR